MNQSDNDFTIKERYTIEELIAIMRFLRGENGCPWDREQDHVSLRNNLLEEAYEAIDAIDSKIAARICDELGDVLMQVVFHAQIAAENGEFDFNDIVGGICRKLISRHTHIFAGDEAKTAEDVIETWEKNKRKEKGQRSRSEVLADVPVTLPALLRSYKIQQKAADAGFDWQDAAGPKEKIFEELGEIEQCLATPDCRRDELEHEVGDLFFAAVNYARHLNVQPETALNKAAERFIRRFSQLESLARKQGNNLENMNLTQMDELWEQVKTEEKKN